MGLNVSTAREYQLENSEILRDTAKKILDRNAVSENTQRIIEKTIFNSNSQIRELYSNSQLTVLKASSQITLNNSLKETLKYLRSHAAKKCS